MVEFNSHAGGRRCQERRRAALAVAGKVAAELEGRKPTDPRLLSQWYAELALALDILGWKDAGTKARERAGAWDSVPAADRLPAVSPNCPYCGFPCTVSREDAGTYAHTCGGDSCIRLHCHTPADTGTGTD